MSTSAGAPRISRESSAVRGHAAFPVLISPFGRGRGGRAVSPGVTWCQHGAGAGADAGAAVGRGGLSPFQAAAPDELAGSGGDGGILQGQPGLHRRGHHRQGEGSLPPSLGLAIGIKLILAEFFETWRGKGHRVRWERCCLCHPAGFSALQCSSGPRQDQAEAPLCRWDMGISPHAGDGGGEHSRCCAGSGGDTGSSSGGSGFPQSAGRRNGPFTGSIFTSPSHKKMFSGSAFLSQPPNMKQKLPLFGTLSCCQS